MYITKTILKKKFLISIILAIILSFLLPEIISKFRYNVFKASVKFKTAERIYQSNLNILTNLISYNNFKSENLVILLNDEIYSNSENNNCTSFDENKENPQIVISADRGIITIDLYGKSIEDIKSCIKHIDEFVEEFEENEKTMLKDLLTYRKIISNSEILEITEKIPNIINDIDIALDSLNKIETDTKNFDLGKILQIDEEFEIILFSLLINKILTDEKTGNSKNILSTEKVNDLKLIEKISENIIYFKPLKRKILYPSLFIVAFCIIYFFLNITMYKNKIKKNQILNFFKNIN